MTSAALNFADGTPLGRIARVDTNRVIIDVSDHDALTRVTVSNLIAIQGAGPTQYAIGLVDGVIRAVVEGLFEQGDDEEAALGEVMRDQVRVVLVGTFWSQRGEKINDFKRGADSFPQIDSDCYLVEGAALQTFMSVLADDLTEDKRLTLGRFVADADAVAIADGNRLFQRHAALLGSTGAGKSWAVALILERAANLAHANLIVIDVHGEYTPLTAPTIGDPIAHGLRIAGPGDLQDTGNDALFLPYWLLNREEMLAMLLDHSDHDAPNQATRFTHHVLELKRDALEAGGHLDVVDTFTVDSPVPYDLGKLIERLEYDNTERVEGKTAAGKAGDFNGKLGRFINRLEAKINDRRLGFMFGDPAKQTDYAWMATTMQQLLCSPTGEPGIKVIDFSEVPSDVLPIVAAVLARTLYDVQFWMEPDKRTPVCLVCDEAHLYLPVKDTADATERRAVEVFERIAKEGRKYGVALFVVSQRPSDVSRTILSQCNNFIAMRLTNDSDQNVVHRLMPDSLAGITGALPLLDLGEALVLGDALLLPTRVKFDEPRIKPASATREFWTEWGMRCPDDKAIAEAVEAFRRQMRA
jgi:uncharacterized protein